MTDNVTQIRPVPDEIGYGQLFRRTATGDEKIVQSIDAGFVCPIGEAGRNLTLRCMVDQGLPLEEQAKIVRNMLWLADMEKAQYELTDLEGELIVRQRALKHAEENVQNVADSHAKRREEIKVEVETLQKAAVQAAQNHERGFRMSGRSGRFKPSAAEQNEITAIHRDVAKLEDELKKIDDDDNGQRNGLMQALANGRLQVSQCKEHITKRRHILGLPE